MAYNLRAGAAEGKKPNAYAGAIKAPSKSYTKDDIKGLTKDYIKLTEEYFDHIPNGAHIRYVKKQKDGEPVTPAEDRFRPGGFLQSHFEKDGKKFMLIGNKIATKGKPGDITFPVAYEDIQLLWKKYDYHAFIEIHLILASLKQKQKTIEELEARISRLEGRR
jgi:hypothetical protein